MWLLGLILTFATGAGAFLVLIPLLFSFVVSIMLRMHVVRTENITECGPFGEFCAGFWCWYCSIAQSKCGENNPISTYDTSDCGSSL
jgi:hypothetical protein